MASANAASAVAAAATGSTLSDSGSVGNTPGAAVVDHFMSNFNPSS